MYVTEGDGAVEDIMPDVLMVAAGRMAGVVREGEGVLETRGMAWVGYIGE